MKILLEMYRRGGKGMQPVEIGVGHGTRNKLTFKKQNKMKTKKKRIAALKSVLKLICKLESEGENMAATKQQVVERIKELEA